MSDLILALLFVLLMAVLAGLAMRLRRTAAGPGALADQAQGRTRVTPRGAVLRTVRRRSLAYWRRGRWMY